MPLSVRRSFWKNIYTTAYILTTVCFIFFVLSIFLSNQIVNLSSNLLEAARGAKFEISRSHLALEEVLNHDSGEELSRLKHSFNTARRNIHALIISGTSVSSWFNPLRDEKLLKKLDEMKYDLERLMAVSIARQSHHTVAGRTGVADEGYDLVFNNLIDRAANMEALIESVAGARLSVFRMVQYLLAAVLLSTITLTGLYARVNLKSRNSVENKLNKEAVDENSEKLRSILRLAPIAIGTIRKDAFQQVNDHMEKMSGYAEEEIIGRSSRLLYASAEEFNRVEKERNEQIAARGAATIETLWRRKDGTVINILYNSTAQNRDNPEKEIIFTALDITSWKKSQVRLKISEERFRLIADNTIDCIWLMDLNLTFRYINPSVFHMLGYTVEEWIGSRLEDHFPASEIELMGTFIEDELMKGANSKGVVFDTNIFNKNGNLVPVEISSKILFDPRGQPVGLQGTTRDISRRKMAEEEVKCLSRSLERRVAERTAQLNAVNKELESFAYSVSHDLRAPLRSIEGFSKALIEDYYDKFDQTGRDYLCRVRKNTNRMGNLIEDILKLSRTISCEMNQESVNLSAMAHLVLDELRIQEKDRYVATRITPDIIVHGDSHLLRVVMDNLLGNAWKFTSRTENTPRIEFGMNKANGSSVCFIKDNGAGFDMAYSDKLFSVFQRLHSNDEFPGCGVGLATVARIIRRHGGRIWAEGSPGRGAVFYFTVC